MSDKYHRLVTFVIDICPKPMRELFITKAKADPNIQYTNLEDYLLFRKPDIDKLLRRSKISLDQFDHIYPASGCLNIQIWDVTLLSTLVRSLFGNMLLQDERDCLDFITSIRNKLQHISSTRTITDKEFNSSWSALKDAVLSLSKFAGAPPLPSVTEEIASALNENLPNLGDVLRTWHKVLYVQLQLQNSELEKKLDLQAAEIEILKEESKKSSTILSKASVKRKGRTGIAEKRLKIVDNKIERMRETLSRALSEKNDCIESSKNDITLITEQLTDNHRVIVTGYDNTLTYKCALAAITELKFQSFDQCLEINNPSDWKRICSEDARCVLFREPFGRASYHPHKVETMLEEFDSMIDATNSDDENIIYIIIVTNQSLLQEVRRKHDHEMLSAPSTVYIDSTTDNIPDDQSAADATVHRNLVDVSKMYKNTCSLKTEDTHTKCLAEKLFLEHNTVAIVGPAASGKTSLSLQLLSSYDLSNGEENFLLIVDPGELKYVNFSLKPVIIIKLLAGLDFDKHEAFKWYRHFDRLLAAVQQRKAAVICVVETEVFRMWKAHIPLHPVLKHIVHMPGTKEKEKEKQMHGCATVAVQTDEASGGHGERTSEDESKTDRSWQIRSVKAMRDYDIESSISKKDLSFKSVCVLPTGEVLVVCSEYGFTELIKLDCDCNFIERCDLPNLDKKNFCTVSYAGNNVAVITSFEKQLDFVDITDMKLTKTLYTRHECIAVACHGSQMYVIDEDTMYLYTSDGEYQKVLYTVGEDCDYFLSFRSIAVSNDGGMIYIGTEGNILFTIDSSGNHLSTLNILRDTGRVDKSISCLCTDNLGYVYAICESSEIWEIVQVCSDGKQELGIVFELEGEYIGTYTSVQFDRSRSALLVAECSNKLKVLTLR